MFDEITNISSFQPIHDKQKQTNETNIINFNDIFKQKNIISCGSDKSKLYDKYMKLVYNTNTRKIKKINSIG